MTTETQLQLVNPRNDAELVSKMRRALIDLQEARVREIDAATASVAENGVGPLKKNQYKDLTDALADGGKKFVGGILAEVGADAVLTQLTATQTAIREAVKRYEAAWTKAKEASEPPTEAFEYIAEFKMTEKAWLALTKKLMKDEVEFRARRVKDGESAKVAKLFAEEVK